MHLSTLYNWKDVTGLFRSSCQRLSTGELFKDDNFGLFEAMSAIEMMDPKMDSGMSQSALKVLTFRQAVEQGKLKVKDFTSEEKLAIFDNSLCHLVTWLDGASLAQTVLTNQYLHEPALIEDSYVRWLSIGLLKLVDLLRSKIIAAGVYEEEDFQAMVYNFKFAADVTEAACIAGLKGVEDESAKAYRQLKGQLQPSGAAEANGDSQLQAKVDAAFALWNRIRFLRSFYQVMVLANENASKHVDELQKHLAVCTELVEKNEKSSVLAAQLSYVQIGKATFPVILGFDPMINQRLLPPTFPRLIRVHSYETTVAELRVLFAQLGALLKATSLAHFNELFDFCLAFGAGSQSVLLRSVLQLVCMPRGHVQRLVAMKEMLERTVNKFIAPPVMQSRGSPLQQVCAQAVDKLLGQCAPTFAALLQVLGHNQARQREKFGHVLADFATLQDEADKLDRVLETYLAQEKSPVSHLACFGSWILFNALAIMSRYVLSGFELELYSPFEFYYVYWYMCEIILNWQINTLSRANSSLIAAKLSQQQQQPGAGKAKKPNKKKIKSVYEQELMVLTAERHMHSAFYQALCALKKQNHLDAPTKELDCEELRYNHRFAALNLINTPPVCLYFQFRGKHEQFFDAYTAAQMYAYSQEHFDQARSIYEKYPQLASSAACIKIAKNNSVVMRLLASGVNKSPKVKFNFAESPYFPLIRI